MRLMNAGKAVTTMGELSMRDLQAIRAGKGHEKILSEMDFFETLAGLKCIVAPPWILRMCGDGGMERVARVQYDDDLNLDRPAILLEVFAALGRKAHVAPFGC